MTTTQTADRTLDCDNMLSEASEALFKARLFLVLALQHGFKSERFDDLLKLQLALSTAQDNLNKLQKP